MMSYKLQSPKPISHWIRMHSYLYQWLKSLRFSNRYSLNISRLVNLEDDRLYGIKIHKYHMFMQKLIPIAYRDLMLKRI
jgi:hypothetical protein